MKKPLSSGASQDFSTGVKYRKSDLFKQPFQFSLAFGVAVLGISYWIPSSLAQSIDSVCFMTTSSGEVISLDSICGSETGRSVQPRDPVDLSSIQAQLRQRLNSGDFQGAIESYTEFLAARPNSTEVYMNRGLLHQQTGDGQAAIADFQQASQLFREQRNEVYYRAMQERIEEVQSEL